MTDAAHHRARHSYADLLGEASSAGLILLVVPAYARRNGHIFAVQVVEAIWRRPVMTALTAEGTARGLLAFYGRRLRRTLPALYLFAGVTLGLGALVLLPSPLADLARSLLAALQAVDSRIPNLCRR